MSATTVCGALWRYRGRDEFRCRASGRANRPKESLAHWLAGWLVAFPIAPLIYFAPSWSWVVVATMLLGVNQGLTWSMTQTAKLDITRPDQRGLVIGLNEFSGYVGVALATVITGYAASVLGPREGLLWFGTGVVLLATLVACLAVAETLPWVHSQNSQEAIATPATVTCFWNRKHHRCRTA